MRARRIFRKLTGKRPRSGTGGLSTPKIHMAVLRAVEKVAPPTFQGDHLDIGSGTGGLLTMLAGRYPLRSFACDYTDELMEREQQKVEIADLNREPLPFGDNRFALVTCTETIEHLENYWGIIREIYRVLQPGGIAVLSTPNILNLRSRFRYLSSGFYNLFGPVMPAEREIHSPRGHINPVSWFYLANALLSTGFEDLDMSIDKYQRRSFLAFPFLIGPISLSNRIVHRRERKKYRSLDQQNAPTVRAMNSPDLLLGRTLIVSARKPR
jgi:ubiquinone/menaquinone biosynthesis C-methylase UbiE